MPKAAIILIVLIFTTGSGLLFSDSYAIHGDALYHSGHKPDPALLSSGIFEIPVDAKQQSDIRRVLIFGDGNKQGGIPTAAGQSIYGAVSSTGFFFGSTDASKPHTASKIPGVLCH